MLTARIANSGWDTTESELVSRTRAVLQEVGVDERSHGPMASVTKSGVGTAMEVHFGTEASLAKARLR